MNKLVLDFVAHTLAKASEMNLIVKKINEIIEAWGTLKPASKRDVDALEVVQDSKNLPTSRAVYDFVRRWVKSGLWRYAGELQSSDDIDQQAEPGSVFVTADDGCANVILGNESDASLYVTVNGVKYTIDTEDAPSLAEFIAATDSGQLRPFADAAYPKVGYYYLATYGYKADAQLVPVRLADGEYMVVMCSTDTASDGRCIRKIVDAHCISATPNSASFEVTNTGEVLDWSQRDSSPNRIGIFRFFGGTVNRLSLASKEWVTKALSGSIPDAIVYDQEITDENKESAKAPTTKAVVDYVKPDEALSSTSTRAVENKVVKRALDSILEWH